MKSIQNFPHRRIKLNKKKNADCVLFLFRRRPTFPGSFPPSIISTAELNYRVRNGNGCDLCVIVTEYTSKCVDIQPRFFVGFFRHCYVKILANALAFAPFLPCTERKKPVEKIFWPQMCKNIDFSRRKVEVILGISRPTTPKKLIFAISGEDGY